MLKILKTNIKLADKYYVGYCGMQVDSFLGTIAWIIESTTDIAEQGTVEYAAYLFNCYCSVIDDISLVDLRYTATACYYISSCLCEDFSIDSVDLEKLTKISAKNILSVANSIMICLCGKLMQPHWKVFVDNLYSFNEFKSQEYKCICDIIRLCLISPGMYNHRPDIIAAATMYLVKSVERGSPSKYLAVDGNAPMYSRDSLLPVMNEVHSMAVYGSTFISPLYEYTLGILENYKTIDVSPRPPYYRRLGKQPFKSIPPFTKTTGIRIKLGSGTCGDVYKIKGDSAVKHHRDENCAVLEISVMCSLSHVNVQSIKCFTLVDGYFVSQMTAQKASLKDLIYTTHTRNEGQLYSLNVWYYAKKIPKKITLIPIQQRRWYAKQLFTGLAYIHNNGIIHRDIKPDNILITATGVVKIADFGMSSLFSCGSSKYLSTNVVTEAYRDYNLLVDDKSKAYSFEIDLWSAGITLMEMETGCLPTGRSTGKKEIIEKLELILGDPDDHLYHNGFDCIDDYSFGLLLRKLTCYLPVHRISASGACEYF